MVQTVWKSKRAIREDNFFLVWCVGLEKKIIYCFDDCQSSSTIEWFKKYCLIYMMHVWFIF